MAKKSETRRRKVGAAALNPSSPVVQLSSVALGFFLGDKINAPIDSLVKGTAVTVPDTTNKIVGAAQVGLGSLLVLGKGKKSLIKTAAGGVLAGAGLKRLLKGFGIMSGFQSVPVLGNPRRRSIAGYQSVPVLGSYIVNGNPAIGGNPAVGGYTVNGGYGSGLKVMGNANASGSGLVHETGSQLMN